jgi:hypothetical protein
MTLRCVENKKSHCQIPIQQRGGLQGASRIAEVLAKETCYSSKNRAFLRNIYIKLQEYVRKFQAIDRSACNACGAWSSASGNAEVLAKETCYSSKNQAYLRNIYIKLQEYVRKFQAIDRSACSACGAWSSASGNAVLAKETCDSSKNRAYLRNICIKLQEYARNFSAIDRSACDACGALGVRAMNNEVGIFAKTVRCRVKWLYKGYIGSTEIGFRKPHFRIRSPQTHRN